jgi:hypothetical protein
MRGINVEKRKSLEGKNFTKAAVLASKLLKFL